jgi:hypothetical protein
MSLIKRTYTLPQKTLKPFEEQVPSGERSALVASLLEGWLEQQRRQHLRNEVAEGCREMAELYLEIEKEYHPLEEEVHRVLEGKPPARRHRARKARSGGGVGTGR